MTAELVQMESENIIRCKMVRREWQSFEMTLQIFQGRYILLRIKDSLKRIIHGKQG